MSVEAVVFDLDGVLIQSEEVWDEVRAAFTRERGGRYDADVQRAMMGMSSTEWSRYLHETAGVPDEPDEINAEVVRRMLAAYEERLPLIDGAQDAVRRLAHEYTLAVASSSNRALIDAVLDAAGLADCFAATVSSEEVARGKPAPDVYLEAARRAGVAPERCAAVEDSHGGIRSAKAAGMRVIAIPNPSYPPDDESLAQADVTLRSLHELTPRTLGRVRVGRATTEEAAGLATRMANHFGHKCDVERDGDTTRIHTRFGVIVLTVHSGELEVRADGDKVVEIAQSHLERFAREPLELVWDGAA